MEETELSQASPLMTRLMQKKKGPFFWLGLHVSLLYIMSLPHLKELRRARGDSFFMQDLSLNIYSGKAVLMSSCAELCEMAL